MEEEFSIEEDVNALLAGEELSEEFQEKAKMIFEAALRSKVSEIKEALEEQYSVALAEEVEEIKTELAERVDAYLEYVSQEWMSENELAIEQGLKTEMTESFLAGMKGLFEEH
jgi:ribosomal protein L23